MSLRFSKNDETPQCANTNGVSNVSNPCEKTNMSSVQNNELTFQQTAFHPVSHAGETWLTSSELAAALGYKKSDAVTQIYSRYHDEFSEKMSTTLKMSVVRKTGAVDIPVRVFSLRGCHLIAMFATTDKAKEFRRWVLDILDREVAHSPIAKQFTDDELQSLCWMWKNTTRMISHIADIEPLLRVAEHRLAPAYYSMSREYCRNTNEVRRLLERETAHVHVNSFTQDNWRVLNNLRIGKIH